MALSANLLSLQGNIKKDPDGYKDEFMLQYRHYQAMLDIFKLRPANEGRQFGELVMFMAQVSRCYPKTTAGFAGELQGLLDTHYAVLEPALRRTLVGALILMRNRAQVEAMTVLPLFFRLFRVQDKALRHQLFRHIVSDIKAANKKTRNERLNRAVQNFMYSVVSDDNESAAKRGLAVLTELWRRHVWRDARTVNVIASAAFHKSSRVMLAVMKFFLGQDKDEDGGSDEERDDDDKKPSGPSKEDVYSAFHKGTRSSKKKKQKKLERAMAAVKKSQRKAAGGGGHAESFAAIHLLHDPQTFAERLFARVQSGAERFETRLTVLAVLSRIIGVHKLLLLNFYPFLQKYIAPHQRDVTAVLAAMVQAVHELVPPETLQPVLRQLVDNFVHDRARPEVVTVGLKAVRELCLRCPLVMDADLLSDLTAYKKYRDKQVSSAARGLIGAFRELYPELLAKKDRGKGADMALKPRAYGERAAATRVDGAELLERALAEGRASEDDDDYEALMPQGSDSDGEDDSDDDSDDELGELESLDGDDDGDDDGEEEGRPRKVQKKGRQAIGKAAPGSGSGGEEDEDEDGDEDSSGWEDVSSEGDGEAGASGSDGEGESEDEEGPSTSGDGEEEDEEEDDEEEGGRRKGKRASAPKAKPLKPKQSGSLADLKRQLAEAQVRRKAAELAEAGGDSAAAGGSGVPIEMERILTQEDFDRIKKLKQRALIEAALAKHGLGSGGNDKRAKTSAAKRARILEAAEEEAAEALELEEKRQKIGESRVNAQDLMGKSKRRHDKEARMATVLEGRKDRERFGARSGIKKKKTGGLSERQKQKKKAMPLAARMSQLKRRAGAARNKKFAKNFKGHVRN